MKNVTENSDNQSDYWLEGVTDFLRFVKSGEGAQSIFEKAARTIQYSVEEGQAGQYAIYFTSTHNNPEFVAPRLEAALKAAENVQKELAAAGKAPKISQSADSFTGLMAFAFTVAANETSDTEAQAALRTMIQDYKAKLANFKP
jgi:hypothetical protein